MTQASDLGGIPNQLAAFYRARVNVNLQAVTTQHYGATEPPVMYANMVWFDSGTGYVKLRSPTNSAWQTIGTIGPPMKFTNVDLPDTSFTTGDVKQTFKAVADSGWVMMNDGTIGDGSSGAYTRANPDTQALFTLLWNNIADAYCPLLAAGTGTGTGRGASAAADWAAHRHIALPRALGRVFAHAGAGYGLLNYAFGSFWGNETVAIGLNNIPSHAHSFTVPPHTHSLVNVKSNQPANTNSGTSMATNGSAPQGTIQTTSAGGASGNTGSAGSGEAHFNIQPTTYLNVMIKL